MLITFDFTKIALHNRCFLGKFPEAFRKMFRKTSLVILPREIIICNENFKKLITNKITGSLNIFIRKTNDVIVFLIL